MDIMEEYRKEKMEDRKCLQCGYIFKTDDPMQTTCSIICSEKYYSDLSKNL